MGSTLPKTLAMGEYYVEEGPCEVKSHHSWKYMYVEDYDLKKKQS